MNEKIREMWEQSKTSGVHPKFGEYDKYSAEKFAELIIRECIEMVSPSDYHQAFPDSHIAGHEGVELLEGTVARIKKHFGVE